MCKSVVETYASANIAFTRMTLTFDLWPWKPFQQFRLTWWIFVASFSEIPPLSKRREIYVSGRTTDGRLVARPENTMPWKVHHSVRLYKTLIEGKRVRPLYNYVFPTHNPQIACDLLEKQTLSQFSSQCLRWLLPGSGGARGVCEVVRSPRAATPRWKRTRSNWNFNAVI